MTESSNGALTKAETTRILTALGWEWDDEGIPAPAEAAAEMLAAVESILATRRDLVRMEQPRYTCGDCGASFPSNQPGSHAACGECHVAARLAATETPGERLPRDEASSLLRGFAADSHARSVLAKAFREAGLANAAESLHALADGIDAGTVLLPAPRPAEMGCTEQDVVEELTEAIRFTVEYVGTETLPPVAGWSWFDALVKYAPAKAAAFEDARPAPTPRTTEGVEQSVAEFQATCPHHMFTEGRCTNCGSHSARPAPAPSGTGDVCPCPIPGRTHLVALHAGQGQVDRVARLLMIEWERVEKPVPVSSVASFADMARAVIASDWLTAHDTALREAEGERIANGFARVVALERCRDIHPGHIRGMEAAVGAPHACESCRTWGEHVAAIARGGAR